MKIAPILTRITTVKNLGNVTIVKLNQPQDVFEKHSIERPQCRCVSFCGHTVHIIDGGNHATNMQHFAKAISKDMDVEMHDVEINLKNKNAKQLKSLEQELKNMGSSKEDFTKEYIAIPASSSVPLLNLQDQIKAVIGKEVKLTPENIKANKPLILNFLKEIYENPGKYRQCINNMDKDGLGLEYTYGVIQQINKLVKSKGAKVFVPAGHPYDETLKWMATQRGLKPELYNYIATGNDYDQVVSKMIKEIKVNNWYNFNLLALSDAKIVTVKGTNEVQDYIFAAYDPCITDGARGIYNFSPVREKGKLIG